MPSFKLFTAFDSNPKVSKFSDRSLEWIGVILHLAPHKRSGYQVCPEARECINPCLNTSGHGRMDNVQDARERKTVMFFENRDYFLKLLDKDIAAAKRYADKLGKRLSVRLNGTSDLFWESLAPHVFSNNPDIQFHDYTKVRRRYRDFRLGKMPENYYLTFSYQPSNHADTMDFLSQGANVAVVFPDQEYPQQWNGYDVINGDEDDFRFLDPNNVIVALYAKGPAKKETNGFVVSV